MNKNEKVVFKKAFANEDFMQSFEGRTLRILSEYLEPAARFKRHKIESTIVFFGSARSTNLKDAKIKLEAAENALSTAKKPSNKLKKELQIAKGIYNLAPYYEAAKKLAYKITLWTKHQTNNTLKLIVTSGGAGGMMQAANEGAISAKGKSIGLNIALPFEQHPNKFISKDLGFEFHYFFMRKFWFIYLAKALVIFPGGFGTLDEFMEALTLLQTKKLAKDLPVVLFGTKFWNDVMNFKKMAEWGVISHEDLDLFFITDSVDDAFDYITKAVQKNISKKLFDHII